MLQAKLKQALRITIYYRCKINGDNEKIQMMKQQSKFHSVNGLLDFVNQFLNI